MKINDKIKTIGIVTTSRADYGIYLPVLKKLRNSLFNMQLYVTGMHLSAEFGRTVEIILNDGFPIADTIEMLLSSDSPDAISKSMGLGIIGFSQSFSKNRPDLLLVLGDRFEMYSAVIAALPYKIPVAHIHGGEITQGAIDDVIRHSITKHSHLHFVSTDEYAGRVYQMGEERWRIVKSGAPGLDNIAQIHFLQKNELEDKLNLSLNYPPVLITFHPVTLEYELTEWQIDELIDSLQNIRNPIVFTLPNADTNGRIIVNKIKQFVDFSSNASFIDNLGTQVYFSLMRIASAMIGNSSSGIIEAASFKLPVVNIGTRQTGRVKGKNVIDTDYMRENIVKAIEKAIHPDFKKSLYDLINPYGTGNASEVIIQKLESISSVKTLLLKKFQNLM